MEKIQSLKDKIIIICLVAILIGIFVFIIHMFVPPKTETYNTNGAVLCYLEEIYPAYKNILIVEQINLRDYRLISFKAEKGFVGCVALKKNAKGDYEIATIGMAGAAQRNPKHIISKYLFENENITGLLINDKKIKKVIIKNGDSPNSKIIYSKRLTKTQLPALYFLELDRNEPRQVYYFIRK